MKAIGLLSGGLDSTLAVRLMLDHGIEVVALKFTSPFCLCDSGGCCHAAQQARRMGVPLKVIAKGEDYLTLVRNPRYGWGSAMNPCIDCRIYMLRKAKAVMEEIGAAFIFTGEVLGQRPMSQHGAALRRIEREAGLVGKIVRPLSAGHLPPSEAERMGWLDRNRLCAIRGRSRRPQIAMARQWGITDYPCPAGGCLLTDRHFAAKLRAIFRLYPEVTMADVRLLKIGRHFWVGNGHVVCGRSEAENRLLQRFRQKGDFLLEPVDVAGPTVLVRYTEDKEVVALAANMVATYSDSEAERLPVRCWHQDALTLIHGARMSRADTTRYLMVQDSTELGGYHANLNQGTVRSAVSS